MKLWAEPDEFWPWFNLSDKPDGFSKDIEIDDKIAERWLVALQIAKAVQEEIRHAVGWDA